MAESKLGEDTDERSHEDYTFSMDVMIFLMNNSGLETSRISKHSYFTSDVGEAILAISNIFHKDFRKICRHLCISLKNIERYRKYCELIPVIKDGCYFYHYLKRIALIYELAVFCYINKYSQKDGYRYFEIGRLCIEKCKDTKFFDSAGGWTGLNRTASFLANIGRPLKLIMLPVYIEDESILTFEDVVKKLRSDYLYSGNTKMLDSQEMACLEKLKGLFKPNVHKVGAKEKKQQSCRSSKLDSSNTNAKKISDDEKEILMVYFQHCQLKAQEQESMPISNVKNEISVQECPSRKDLAVPEIGSLQHVNISNIAAAHGTETDKPPEVGRNKVKEIARDISSILIKLRNTLNPTLYQSKQRELDATAENREPDNDVEDPKLMASLEGSDDLEENRSEIDSKVVAASEKLSRTFNISLGSPLSHSSPSGQCDISRKSKNAVGEASCSGMQEPREATALDSIQNYEKDKPETECSIIEENDVKRSFVVPQNYTNCMGNSDECKYLYRARMFPPLKREKLDEHLKTILDTNIINQNYKQMSSGDIFVCPPGSSQKEETLVIFVDSSTDDESSEDTYKLICLFKKDDVEFEENSYNLRPREFDQKMYLKNELTRTEGKKPESHGTGTTAEMSRRLKVRTKVLSRDRAVYAKLLTKLYKKCLPVILDECLQALLRKPVKYKVSSSVNPDTCTKRNNIFIITARMLAKRKIQLIDFYKHESILGLSLDRSDFEPRILLSPQLKELDSCIKNLNYHSVEATNGCIYVVGLNSLDRSALMNTKSCWVLFPSAHKKSSSSEYNSEVMQVYRLYKESMLDWADIPERYRNRILMVENYFLSRYTN